jgi:hypothetical protein
MTYRYDPLSSWLDGLQDFFGDLDSKRNQQDGVASGGDRDDAVSLTRVSFGSVALIQMLSLAFFPLTNACFSKVFVSFADCNVDYTTPSHFKTPSRSILRVGDLRISSNIVKPAPSVQAYSVSVGDISWLLCNNRSPHNFENSLLPGGGDVMARKDLVFRSPQGRGAPVDAVFRDMCSKTILTLESIDAILVKNIDSDRSEGSSSNEPLTTISLTLGELSLYACKDSFQCFSESIGELQTLMTAKTDEQVEQIRCNAQRSQGKVDEAVSKKTSAITDPNKSRFDVAAIPIDTEDDFLLDGYDWTTVDHQNSAEIPPDEEQTARWFHSAQVSESGPDMTASFQSQSSDTASAPRIITQHFPLQVVQEPFGTGGLDDAAKLAGTSAITVGTRVLLHDMKVKIRLFDGYDWPEAQGSRKRDPKALFVISETKSDASKTGAAKNASADQSQAKSALLGGLLASDNDTDSPFGDLPLPEDRVRITLAQNDLRRLARRTSNYIQVSAEGISLRLESYSESLDHRLNSCLYLSAKDFFFAETLSRPNPVKMFGEWFNEVEHPRDSKEGLLTFKVRSSCCIMQIFIVFRLKTYNEFLSIS